MRDAPTYQESWVRRRRHRLSTVAHRRQVLVLMEREIEKSAIGRWLMRWLP